MDRDQEMRLRQGVTMKMSDVTSFSSRRKEGIFEEMMADKFPEMVRDSCLHIQEAEIQNPRVDFL